MPGHPFQCVRNPTRRRGAFGPLPWRFARAAHRQGALNLRRSSNRTSPPQKKNKKGKHASSVDVKKHDEILAQLLFRRSAAQARRKANRTFNGRMRAFLLIFQRRRRQPQQEMASRFSHALQKKGNNRPAAPAWKTERRRSAPSADPSDPRPFFLIPLTRKNAFAAELRPDPGAAAPPHRNYTTNSALISP